MNVEDSQGNVITITGLEFAAQYILSFWSHQNSTLTAVTHFLLTALHHQPLLLKSEWVKMLCSEIKKKVDTYHSTVLDKYA